MVGYPKPVPVRLPGYLEYLTTLPCIACDRIKTEYLDIVYAHQGFGHGGTSTKNNDSWALPLCMDCHRKEHDLGVETFWKGIDRKMKIVECLAGYIQKGC